MSEKHTPGPVWLIYFDDYDRRPEIITAEDAARKRYWQISASWNAHLFVKVQSNSRDCPYYAANATLASPDLAAEVERLRAENDELREREALCLASTRDAQDHAMHYGRELMETRETLAAERRKVEALRPTQAAADVLAERRRQVEVNGWTPEHDDEHDGGRMAAAGSAYALAAADHLHPLSQGDGCYDTHATPLAWPQDWEFKPADPRRMLVKAGALILAEIERLDRAALAATEQKGGA